MDSMRHGGIPGRGGLAGVRGWILSRYLWEGWDVRGERGERGEPRKTVHTTFETLGSF